MALEFVFSLYQSNLFAVFGSMEKKAFEEIVFIGFYKVRVK